MQRHGVNRSFTFRGFGTGCRYAYLRAMIRSIHYKAAVIGSLILLAGSLSGCNRERFRRQQKLEALCLYIQSHPTDSTILTKGFLSPKVIAACNRDTAIRHRTVGILYYIGMQLKEAKIHAIDPIDKREASDREDGLYKYALSWHSKMHDTVFFRLDADGVTCITTPFRSKRTEIGWVCER